MAHLFAARRLATVVRRPASSLAKDRWPATLADSISRSKVSVYGETVPLAATGKVQEVGAHRVEITPFDANISKDVLKSLRENLGGLGRGVRCSARCYWDAQLAKLVVATRPASAPRIPVALLDAAEDAALAAAEAEALVADAPEHAAIEYWARAGDHRAPFLLAAEEQEDLLDAAPRATTSRRRRSTQRQKKPCKAERRALDSSFDFRAARRASNGCKKTMRQINKQMARQWEELVDELVPPSEEPALA